jgi:hypothetical protein
MDHLLIKGVVTKNFKEYIDVFMKIFLEDFINFGDMSTHIKKFNKCFIVTTLASGSRPRQGLAKV